MNFIINAGQVAGAIGAILGVFGLIIKWGVVKPIKAYIDVKTAQIQPNANGGKSLPDIALMTSRIENKLVELDERIKKLESKRVKKS